MILSFGAFDMATVFSRKEEFQSVQLPLQDKSILVNTWVPNITVTLQFKFASCF